jgi:formylglycine-generating enzyme required for sulfatase activity
MVFVEGGTFFMGCTDEQGGDCDDDEILHQVTLSSFKIAKYSITQKQWETIMGTTLQQQQEITGETIYSIAGEGDDYPMYFVRWNDAQEFIKRLNAITGKNYRLPTEAEWEYAARGGQNSKRYKYSGSNDINAVAWYENNSGMQTHPVGKKAPNELGLYDMCGNVGEWCSDWLGDYTDLPQTNPHRTEMSTWGYVRAIRGGAVNFPAIYCRVAQRFGTSPERAHNTLGFRLVLP